MAENETNDRPPLHDLRGVKYVGTADVRTISAQELAAVGVTAKSDLSWDRANGHLVAVGQLNAATVDFLATQEDFELV